MLYSISSWREVTDEKLTDARFRSGVVWWGCFSYPQSKCMVLGLAVGKVRVLDTIHTCTTQYAFSCRGRRVWSIVDRRPVTERAPCALYLCTAYSCALCTRSCICSRGRKGVRIFRVSAYFYGVFRHVSYGLLDYVPSALDGRPIVKVHLITVQYSTVQ